MACEFSTLLDTCRSAVRSRMLDIEVDTAEGASLISGTSVASDSVPEVYDCDIPGCGMATVSSREAIAYAFSRDMAILYGFVLAGYVAIFVGSFLATSGAIRGGGAGFIRELLAIILIIAGFVGVLGGVIGFVYKIIADANDVARA